MVTQNKEEITEHIKMSIQVSLNGLSFCALSNPEKKILFFRDYRFSSELNPIQALEKLETVYEKEAFLREEKPEEIVVIFSNDLFSLVPEALFSENLSLDFLKFNTKILEGDAVAHDQLRDLNIYNVYIPYANFINFFFDRYGAFESKHSMSVLLEGLVKKEAVGPVLYAHLHHFGFDLIAVQDGKLILANSFACKTAVDFAYYLLFTIEQLNLDPEKVKLSLLGSISRDSEYFDLAYTYIRNVELYEHTFGFVCPSRNQGPDARKNFSLLNVLQ